MAVDSNERLGTEAAGSAESLTHENLPGEGLSAITFRNPAIALFVLDGLANVIDFAFHFWMGRILIPSDFAVLQTLNSIVLVYVTASGVFQPVVGRFIAEARGKGEEGSIPAIFRSFLRAALILGTVLSILCFTFSAAISHLLNLPPWTIQLSAALVFLSTLRPIAAGALQGQERFLAFGFTRLALSLGRILLIILFRPSGITMTIAIAALPFGWLVSVMCAFLLIGSVNLFRHEGHKENLRKANLPVLRQTLVNLVIFVVKIFRPIPTPQNFLRDGWKLSAYALLAYFAYMSLTSLDLVWVNRSLGGDSAGAYASLVLMRRVVALFPGVAVTIMFPRIVKILVQGKNPHRLLVKTALIILSAGGALTILYFLFADRLLAVMFKGQYQAAASLLGPMGIAMIGVSLSSIWLNYYLAERPRNFVILLLVAVALEWILLNVLSPSLQNAVVAFGLTGWLLSVGGLILYSRRLPRGADGATRSDN